MITKTFPSGNATAVLLPQELVEQYHLENEVAVVAVEDGVLIKSVQTSGVAPREEWASLFARAQQESRLPVAAESNFVENEFDKTDWTWPINNAYAYFLNPNHFRNVTLLCFSLNNIV